MATFQHLLSHARRHCIKRNPSRVSQILLASPFHRPLSSSSEPQSESAASSGTPPDRTPRNPIPLQTVSYPVKPKESPDNPPQQQHGADSITRTRSGPTWTREEIRYVKDTPAISPVSYPTKVAPLPEDRVAAAEEGEGKGIVDEEMERERRRIEEENRMMPRRVLRGEEEKVGFATVIVKDRKKKDKVVYDLKEAILLAKADAKRNFDETLEAHVRLTPEMKRSDLKLMGSVRLPHGHGRKVRVAVFAEGTAADEARDAGADVVGGLDLIEEIKKGGAKLDFDLCIATESMMARGLVKLSKILKRNMPKKDNGTVTSNVSRAVKDVKERLIHFNKEKAAIVHVGLGKMSYSEEALSDNISAFVNALLLAKPAGLKKSSKYAGYVNSFHICSTMGQSYPVSIQSVSVSVDRYNRLHM